MAARRDNDAFWIHHKTVDHIDVKTRLILRKVSKQFRNVVDTTNLHLTRMSIEIGDEVIVWKIGSPLNIPEQPEPFAPVSFRQHKNGCMVTHNNKERFVKDNFVKSAVRDICIFAQNDRMTIENLCIGVIINKPNDAIENKRRERTISSFYEELRKGFETFSHWLKVKELSFEMDGQYEAAFALLPFFRPIYLETLEFRNRQQNRVDLPLWSINDTAQYRRAKSLYTYHFIVRIGVMDILHFDNCKMLIDSLKEDDLLMMKEIYSRNPNFVHADFLFTTRATSLGQFGPMNVGTKCTYVWPVADSDKSIVVSSDGRRIGFSKED